MAGEPAPADRSATAGELAVAGVPRASSSAAAREVRETLATGVFEAATEVAILEDERLVGLVPVERLLAAPDAARVGDLVTPVAAVDPDLDVELVARQSARSRARSVPVVDRDGRFRGLVPAERLLFVLEMEHEEDLARLGGYVSRARQARTAAEEEVPRRLWHRLPWLVLGLLGAMASAVIIGSFEEEIRQEVLLALFIPAVVYMADAVGTQTETVVIRGMSVGIPLRDIVGRELLTGLVIGVLIAAAFFPFALAVWGNEQIAATVSLALVISCSVATVVAMGLPYAIARFGGDPAFGSGPLATVVQDLLSILAYFAVALAFF